MLSPVFSLEMAITKERKKEESVCNMLTGLTRISGHINVFAN